MVGLVSGICVPRLSIWRRATKGEIKSLGLLLTGGGHDVDRMVGGGVWKVGDGKTSEKEEN